MSQSPDPSRKPRFSVECPRCGKTTEAIGHPPNFCAHCGYNLTPTVDPDPPATVGPLAGGYELTAVRTPLPQAAAEPVVPSPERKSPSSVGNYRLIRKLGQGGMGRVFEVEDPSGRRFALKLILTTATSTIAIQRFRQEGRLAGLINHPRCVFVHAVDEDQGRPYIVMELMPGKTLNDLVAERGPLPVPEAIARILEVIEGLEEAHRLSVIHRDVKPSNCFLMPDGTVKVGDFGLSKSLVDGESLTSTGAFLGTVLYAAPEQIRGEAVDYAADVYSVAATLYFLLTKHTPYEHDNPTAVMARIIAEPATPPRVFRPGIPPELERVVLRGLERDRAKRYANLEDLREDLLAILPGSLTLSGQGVRVGAYLLDEIILDLAVIIPTVCVTGPDLAALWRASWLTLLLYPVYFTVTDGLLGGSLGKRLLGLRVAAVGSTAPPGWRRGLIRTMIFFALLHLTWSIPWFFVSSIDSLSSAAWLFGPVALGWLLLVLPMRAASGFRGFHEQLSETCVLQEPTRERAIRLQCLTESSLASLPAVTAPWPRTIGTFPVTHAVGVVGGPAVLLAEDELLGRKILVRLDRSSLSRPLVDRPARLRHLGQGTVDVAGMTYHWETYVAPDGFRLSDAVAPGRGLDWAATHRILIQLAQELQAACADNSLPPSLSVQQVWVQPNGRVQLLEMPVGGAVVEIPPGPCEQRAIALLRQAAVLSLEGQSRTSAEQARAVVPLYAGRILNKLAGGKNAYSRPAELLTDLENYKHAPRHLTRPCRVAHLLLVMILMGPLWGYLLARSGLFAAQQAAESAKHTIEAERAIEFLRDPKQSMTLAQTIPAAKNPKLIDELRTYLRREQGEYNRRLAEMTWGERLIVQYASRWLAAAPLDDPASCVTESVARSRSDFQSDWASVSFTLTLLIGVPAGWVLWSGLTGGLTRRLFGIAVVDAAGRVAGFGQMTARAAYLWIPSVFLLIAAALTVLGPPGLASARIALLLGAVVILLIQLIYALYHPERAWHDRLAGTFLVPR